MLAGHQEYDVVVTAVAPAGTTVQADGHDGFIDQAEHPSWWSDTPRAAVGDRMRAVVLDATGTPPRFSDLPGDLRTARSLRHTEPPARLCPPPGGGRTVEWAAVEEALGVATRHQVLPDAQYSGVQLACFMDRDGPVQPESWRLAVAQARATGSPLPPLVPDGIYGLRADGALAAESSEQQAEIAEEHRRLNTVLNQVAQPSTQPPEEGQWDGGRIKDTYGDFAPRYAFAFWRLAAQGVTVLGAPREPGEDRPRNRPGAQPADPDVHVIRLANQVPAQRSAEDGGTSRVYHHRWTVRMHKVRQRYPSAREHRFAHYSNISGTGYRELVEGEKVTFDVTQGQKGPQAENIVRG